MLWFLLAFLLLLLHYSPSAAFVTNPAKWPSVSSKGEQRAPNNRSRPLLMAEKKQRKLKAKKSKAPLKSKQAKNPNNIKKAEEEEESIIPPEIQIGTELLVKLFYVSENYALGVPLSANFLKGKISKDEVSDVEFNSCQNMTDFYDKGDIVEVSVMQLNPPDRLELSVRRARKVLSDDFKPYTLAVFDLPTTEILYEDDVEKPFEDYGTVMEVTIPQSYYETEDDFYSGPVFVTMERAEDAMRAMENLRRFNMTFPEGDTLECGIRIRTARKQDFKERLQKQLDLELEQNIETWDETPYERRTRLRAEEELCHIIPWYCQDLETRRHYSYLHAPRFDTRIVKKANVVDNPTSKRFNSTKSAYEPIED